jgi:hypothetical protein
MEILLVAGAVGQGLGGAARGPVWKMARPARLAIPGHAFRSVPPLRRAVPFSQRPSVLVTGTVKA